MGKFDFEISPEFIRTLGRLQDVDRIAPKMINKAIPILEQNVISEVSRHKRTGQVADSIKRTRASKTKKGGYYATVKPTGESTYYINAKGERKELKKPVSNTEILMYAEYGTSKQASTPMLTKAIKDSEAAVLAKMQEVFEKEVGKK